MDTIRQLARSRCALESAIGVRTRSTSDDGLDAGCVCSQLTKAAAVRSSNRSMGRCVSRSSSNVPYRRCSFLSATSSTPAASDHAVHFGRQRMQQAKRRTWLTGARRLLRARRAPASPAALSEGDSSSAGFVRPSSVMGQRAIEALEERSDVSNLVHRRAGSRCGHARRTEWLREAKSSGR